MDTNGDYGTPVDVYVGENVSNIIVKLIQSYTGVIDKMVWRKQILFTCWVNNFSKDMIAYENHTN